MCTLTQMKYCGCAKACFTTVRNVQLVADSCCLRNYDCEIMRMLCALSSPTAFPAHLRIPNPTRIVDCYPLVLQFEVSSSQNQLFGVPVSSCRSYLGNRYHLDNVNSTCIKVNSDVYESYCCSWCIHSCVCKRKN